MQLGRDFILQSCVMAAVTFATKDRKSTGVRNVPKITGRMKGRRPKPTPQHLQDHPASEEQIRSNQNASASEIATIPFGNWALLLQCGGAHAKLPRTLVLLEAKQLVTKLAHRVGIIFSLGNGGSFQNVLNVAR